jgi:flavin-dependent dehydrogenase
MEVIKTSVCIIGAGPAGATASLFLSQYGITHVLADRASFPRDKVCGEAFSGRVSHVLRELGIEYEKMIEGDILQKTHRVRLVLQPENKYADYCYKADSTPILKGKRSVFDAFLNKKAQESRFTTYLDNTSFNSFDKQPDGVILTSEDKSVQIKAQIVLFCTGERVKFLQDIVGQAYPSEGEMLLISRQYFKNIAYEKGDAACEAHLYTKPCNHYMIINPLPNDLSLVEVAMTKKDFQAHNIHFETFFKNTIQSSDSLRERFQYATPLEKAKGISMLLGKNPRLLSAERMLFVGSAAGSIHPFTGFGVGHAMRMAQMAAFQAAQSVQQKDFSAKTLQKYDKAVRARMRSDFFTGEMLHFIMRHLQRLLPIVRFVFFSNTLTSIFSGNKKQQPVANAALRFKESVK